MNGLNLTTYDQNACIGLCYQDFLLQNCNCYAAEYPPIKNRTRCFSISQFECIANVSEIYFKSNNSASLCGFSCPIECDIINYQISTSISSFPTKYYLNLLAPKTHLFNGFDLKDQNVLNNVRNYILKVTVNYDKYGYTLINELPSSLPTDLIGNIGGQFGLFIGISLLSFVEILELLMELMFSAREHYRRK